MARSTTITAKILADNAGLKKGLSESAGLLSRFGGGAGKLLKKSALATGLAVATAAGGGFVAALGREGLADKFGEQLGLGSDQAKDFIRQAADVYSANWGGSVTDVAKTLADIKGTTLGSNLGSGLENAGVAALSLAEKYGVDVTQAINSAAEAVESGLVGNADQAFDLFDAGLKKMPATIRSELFAASDEYGDFFADLGFSGEETFGALTNFAQSGIYGIDKFGDAIKELSIRGTDGSKASREAFEAMGKDAGAYGAALLGGGEGARKAVDGIVDGLLGIQDPVAQANAAIGLFGTPLEDLSTVEIPAFLADLGAMGEGFSVVEGQALASANVMGDNLVAKLQTVRKKGFEKFTRFMEDNVLPAVENVVDAMISKWPEVESTITRVAGKVSAAAKAMFDGILPVARRVVAGLIERWPAIREAVTSTATAVQQRLRTMFDNVMPKARQVINGLVENWPRIKTAVTVAVVAAKAAILTLIGAFENVGAGVQSTVTRMRELNLIGPVVAGLSAALVAGFGIWAASATAAGVASALAGAQAAIAWAVAAAPMIALIAGIAAVVAAVVWAYQNFETFRNVVDTVAAAIAVAIGAVVNVAQMLFERSSVIWPLIAQVISGAVAQVIEKVQSTWNGITAAFTAGFAVVSAVVTAGIAVVTAIWGAFGTVLTELARVAWDLIKGVVSGGIDIIKGIINVAVGLITGDWQQAWDGIKQILSGAWEVMKSVVTAAVAAVVAVVTAAWAAVSSGTTAAWNAIKSAIDTVWNAIKSAVSAALDVVVGTVKRIWNSIKDWVSGTASAFAAAATTVWEAIKAAISAAMNAIKSSVEGKFNEIRNWISGQAGALRAAGSAAFTALKDGLIGALSGVAAGIRDKVLGPIASIQSAVSSLIGSISGIRIPSGGGGSRGGGSGSRAFHDGGFVERLGRRVPGYGRDEVPNVTLQSGEFVLSRAMLADLERGGGSSEPAPFIGQLVVSDGRSIDDELRLVQALRGL